MKTTLLTKLRIIIILLLSLSLNLKAQTGIPNAINYTLPADELHVSGGIYLNGVLIRTAFSNEHQAVGTHTYVWDGYDEDGNLQATGGTFQLKIAYNNNVYTWEGVVGNSSDSTTGIHVWRGGSQITCATQVGSKVFVGTGYSEQNAQQKYFNVSTPQQCTTYSAQAVNYSGQTTYFNCASSKYIFWAGPDWNFTHTFVFPERLSDLKEPNFSNSVLNPTSGRGYHAIDLGIAPITGIACQQNGNGYLFIAHGSTNTIDVLRTADSSGVNVQTISITNPGNLAVENDNVLWVAQGTTLTKYSINTSTGAIIPTGIQITGFANIVGLHVQSGDLAVLDGGNQQILKRYNSTSLALTGTIGQLGGYANVTAVTNNRFYLNDLQGQLCTFVTHDASGGFWIGDAGNARIQHFDASGNFIESVMHIGTYCTYTDGSNKGICYPVNICQNQNTALFSDFMEFAIDYSKPLQSGWTLVNNYGYNLPAGWHNTNSITGVNKYSNGHRYMIITQKGGTNNYLAELTSTGLRIIYTPLLPQFCAFDKSGNVTTFNITNKYPTTPPQPAVLTYQKYTVTFNSSFNPIISTPITIATIASGYQEPIPLERGFHTTTNGKIVVMDPGITGSRNLSFPKYYHYGIYDSLTMARIARMGIGTPRTYAGDFLMDGTYEAGNSVNYGGGTVATIGNCFYAGYHGEGFKGDQTNIFYKFNDIGLVQGVFGVLGKQVIRGTAPYGFAGNALVTNAVSVGGNDYIYHSDESAHNGTHRWKISNTASEGLQTVTFKLTNATYTVQNNIVDFLVNIPGGQVSINGLTGTSQLPTTDVKIGTYSGTNGQFYSTTATNNYYSFLAHDVQLYATALTGSRYWKFNVTAPAQWSFYGQLDLTINSFVANESSSIAVNYIELTDNAGKSIVRMYLYNSNRIKINGTFIGPFNKPKSGATDFVLHRVQNSNNIYFQANIFGTPVTYTGAMQDVTADITHPASFGVNVQNLNVGFHIGVNKLRSIL